MTAFMRVVTALGGPVVLPIVALGGILVTRLRTHTWSYAALIGITAVGSTLITVAAKTIVGRSRPPLESAIATENGDAFPSGHSLNSLAIYGVLALVAILATTAWSRRVWVAVSAATLVTLVGLSRLYLGVHWLTDVLGAWTLGGAWLTAVTFVWWYTVRPRGLSGGHPGQWKTDTEDRAGSGAAAPTGAHALPPHGIIAHNPGSPGLEWPTARRRQR
jgi:undecaprenyl-diphosphatase